MKGSVQFISHFVEAQQPNNDRPLDIKGSRRNPGGHGHLTNRIPILFSVIFVEIASQYL